MLTAINQHIAKLLFLAGIFFIPFNSYEGVPGLGEFKSESAGLFFLALFGLAIVTDLRTENKLFFPYKRVLHQIILLFVLWLLLTTLFNINTVLPSFLKKTSGINRFVRQYFALILSVFLFTYGYWSVMRKTKGMQIFYAIRNAFLLSLSVVAVYGLFEILYIKKGLGLAYTMLKLFDYFPFVELDIDSTQRISSVCFEPPSLGTFLIMIAGWMFSYALERPIWKNFVPGAVVLILTYFSGSRTALFVVLFQLVVFIYYAIGRAQFLRFLGKFAIIGLIGGLVVVGYYSDSAAYRDVKKKITSLDFASNLTKNVSNKSRFGIQAANWEVFKEHPIIGVGFGQQAYHAIYHYPIWAKKDNYEFKVMYLNNAYASFPPGYNMYIRLLAETGLIGFALFVLLLITMFKQLHKILRHQVYKKVSIVLIISQLGFCLNWFQGDMFRVYGFWINIMLIIFYMKSLPITNDQVDKSTINSH